MPVVSCGSGRSVRLMAPDQLSSFLYWVEGNAPSDQQRNTAPYPRLRWLPKHTSHLLKINVSGLTLLGS
ncbi:hypothetical protein QQF64_022223 [Cirrhinus molitorella]|uniref:Uncharacterized protein n=2 Tax=Cirrhinus molitorella TaxID=172907 RepID=A0AA88P437_9TELE|nr:hypothetical protein Q8A67_024269 [Cirrhinus molitorella]